MDLSEVIKLANLLMTSEDKAISINNQNSNPELDEFKEHFDFPQIYAQRYASFFGGIFLDSKYGFIGIIQENVKPPNLVAYCESLVGDIIILRANKGTSYIWDITNTITRFLPEVKPKDSHVLQQFIEILLDYLSRHLETFTIPLNLTIRYRREEFELQKPGVIKKLIKENSLSEAKFCDKIFIENILTYVDSPELFINYRQTGQSTIRNYIRYINSLLKEPSHNENYRIKINFSWRHETEMFWGMTKSTKIILDTWKNYYSFKRVSDLTITVIRNRDCTFIPTHIISNITQILKTG